MQAMDQQGTDGAVVKQPPTISMLGSAMSGQAWKGRNWSGRGLTGRSINYPDYLWYGEHLPGMAGLGAERISAEMMRR